MFRLCLGWIGSPEMTFTTPKRKVSPRTRKKYINLKSFLRKSGNEVANSIDANINSNVSDDKTKMNSSINKDNLQFTNATRATSIPSSCDEIKNNQFEDNNNNKLVKTKKVDDSYNCNAKRRYMRRSQKCQANTYTSSCTSCHTTPTRASNDTQAAHKPEANTYNFGTTLTCHENINYNYKNSNSNKHHIRNQYKTIRDMCCKGERNPFSAPICRDEVNDYGIPQREHGRNKYTDIYYDSNMYDMVPVKEKRYKTHKHKETVHNSKEIPPSARSHRPQLNLEPYYVPEVDESSTRYTRKYSKTKTNECEKKKVEDTTSSRYDVHLKLNSAQTSPEDRQDYSAKTNQSEKILSEIKDMLQSFLEEIRNDNNPQLNTSKPNCQTRQPPCNPYLQLLPIYPINYMQNGYVMRSNDLLCTNCEKHHSEDDKTHITEELIKKIYKYVIQKPTTSSKTREKTQPDDTKRTKYYSKMVGTRPLRKQSKSCETFGSRTSETIDPKTQRTISDMVVTGKRDAVTTSVTTDGSITTVEKEKQKNIQKLLNKLGIKSRKNVFYEVESNSDVQMHQYDNENLLYRNKNSFEATNRTPQSSYGQFCSHQPICFKEIEVRNIATQSGHKLKRYFFGSLKTDKKPDKLEAKVLKPKFSWKKVSIKT